MTTKSHQGFRRLCYLSYFWEDCIICTNLDIAATVALVNSSGLITKICKSPVDSRFEMQAALGFKNGNCGAKNKTLTQKHLAICTGLVVLVLLSLAFVFSTLSAPLRDVSPQTIEYAIDQSAQGTERELLMKAVKQATAMWSDQNPGLEFMLTDKQDVLQIRASMPAYVDAVVYVTMSLHADGFTECPIWDTDTTACIVYIHPYLLHASTIDLSPAPRINTIAHEFGHVLGLSHFPDSNTNHLMGTPSGDSTGTSTDTKGYVVLEPIPLI